MSLVDLHKPFERVLQQVVQMAMRKLVADEWVVLVIMTMSRGSLSYAKKKDVINEEFEMKDGVHQGSVLEAVA